MSQEFLLRKDDYKRFKDCFKIAWALANVENLQQVNSWVNEKAISVFKIPLEYSTSKIDNSDFEEEPESDSFASDFKKYLNEIEITEAKIKESQSTNGFSISSDSEIKNIVEDNSIASYPGEAIADGLEVGHAAQEYFQRDYSCCNLEIYQFFLALKKTQEVIYSDQYQIFFEPAFKFQDCITRCDILIRLPDNTFELIEVKASTGNKYNSLTDDFEPKSLNKKHKYDIAYQYYVLTGCGIKISKISLMFLDRSYIRVDDIDYDELFYFRSVYDFKKNISLLDYAQALNQEIDDKKILSKNETYIVDDLNRLRYLMKLPLAEILNRFQNGSCENAKPDTMPFYYGYCQHVTAWLPEHHHVFELSGTESKYANRTILLYEEHIKKLTEIDKNFHFTNEKHSLSLKQQRQINVINNRDTVIAKNQMEYLFKQLDSYQVPIYMYDFETMKAAIPRFDYSFSYQQIPFQYSVHVIYDKNYTYHNPKTMHHHAYLADGSEDPRLELIKHLIKDLFHYGQGVYVAYFQRFEKTRLQELQEYLQSLIADNDDEIENSLYETYIKKLHIIQINTIDLMDFFKDFAIYLPEFYGSTSIKKTLPAFDQKFSYQDLKIRKGDMASEVFRRRVDDNISSSQWLEKFREPMLQYCNRDTLAMVVILEHIEHLLKESGYNNEKI